MEKIFKYIFISIHEKKINVLYVELYIKYSTCDFLVILKNQKDLDWNLLWSIIYKSTCQQRLELTTCVKKFLGHKNLDVDHVQEEI